MANYSGAKKPDLVFPKGKKPNKERREQWKTWKTSEEEAKSTLNVKCKKVQPPAPEPKRCKGNKCNNTELYDESFCKKCYIKVNPQCLADSPTDLSDQTSD